MSTKHYPFDEISPWVREPADLRPALAEDTEADVVIVGGGYTGLSTALAMRRAGADVALLEARFAGCGASGRNAGHLTPTIGKDIPTLLLLFGKERVAKLVDFADRAVTHTEQTIRDLAIDCEYAPTGNVMAGVHPKQESRLRKAAEAAKSLGADVDFVSPQEMRNRGIPEAFRFGVLEKRGGTLDPGRYVAGLRSAALAAGVRLFEDSPLTALEQGPSVVARTSGGSVRAKQAVLATNAYTQSTGVMPRTVAACRVSLFETEELPPDDLARLGWQGREGVYTAHEALEDYRLSHRNTIVGGSKTVRYEYGGELAPAYAPEAFAIIERAFRARFPTLSGIRVQKFWSGWIALTPDFLPVTGVSGTHDNVFYGLGYCGHGVAQATLMGELLSERMLGREHELEAALRRRTWRWPPEPLTWVGARVLQGALEAIDRRTDRQIAALRPR